MASVCGGSLAMMDAGVPLKRPVAGIAMGLVMDEKTGKYAVLSDIAGAEDHYGDMDFKVAGTADGITALQMDIKVSGITTEVMTQGARSGAPRPPAHPREMDERAGRPRESISQLAPRIVTIRIPVDKIRDVIGPGGKMIRSIIERTGVKIDVEDDGRVNVASADEGSARKAISIIQELTATPELNKTYMGKVQRITDFGAFVEIMPGTDGLLHVSEIANHRVKGRARRAEGGRAGHGEGNQHRSDGQNPPQPQSAAAARGERRRRQAVLIARHRPQFDRGERRLAAEHRICTMLGHENEPHAPRMRFHVNP
jgi:polyribonucleotide nucleotidyltransferase